MRRPNRAAAALLVASVTACSPAAATTPTPTPTAYHCIDDGRLKAGPCTKADYDQQQKEQALFTEAKQLFVDFEAERNRLQQAGGADEPTAELLRVGIDPFLTDVMKFLRAEKAEGGHMTGEMKVGNFAIERGETRPGAVFEVRACEDGRQTHGITADGRDTGAGDVQALFIFYRYRNDRLVIMNAIETDAFTCNV